MIEAYLHRGMVVTVAAQRLIDGADCFSAWPDDFPGCIAEGRSLDEAIERLEAVLPSYLSDIVSEGRQLPNELPKIIPGLMQFYDETTGELPQAQTGKQSLASFPTGPNTELMTV